MLGRLTDGQCKALLRRATIGRIGVTAEGRTYVVPITFVFDGGYVYGHSSLGQKVRMMRANHEVGFETDEIVDMANWKCVIARGRYEELAGDLATAAARLIQSRLAPLTTSQTAGPSGPRARGRRGDVAYRIALSDITGRYERQTPTRMSGRRRLRPSASRRTVDA